VGVKLGTARFDPQKCTNCMVCLRRCPIEKAVFFPNPAGGPPWYKGQEGNIPSGLNTVMSPIKPVIDENLCVGCGLCAAHCIPKIIRLHAV
jgi:ferredoxin-type protein NapG